ncbi:MAG: hypothetical protein ACO3C1_01740 [Ilumatobacteraceae bacterium]
MLRRLAAIASVPLVLAAAVSACSDNAAEAPPGTVGAVPPPPTPETLLPLVTDTSVAETGSVPPDTLFGGDPCTALSVADLRGAASQVPPSATDPTLPADETGASVTAAATVEPVDAGPVSTVAVSGDACEFRVLDPVRYSVLVRITTVFEYETPDATTSSGTELDIVAVPGVGTEAKGIDWGDRYEVLVKVADGWFVLEAPDRVTAVRLAGDAADRCCG